mgnify:CR=1 FL=1
MRDGLLPLVLRRVSAAQAKGTTILVRSAPSSAFRVYPPARWSLFPPPSSFFCVHLTDNAHSPRLFKRAVAEIAYELLADFPLPRLV